MVKDSLVDLLRAFEPSISSRIPEPTEVLARIDVLKAEVVYLRSALSEAVALLKEGMALVDRLSQNR